MYTVSQLCFSPIDSEDHDTVCRDLRGNGIRLFSPRNLWLYLDVKETRGMLKIQSVKKYVVPILFNFVKLCYFACLNHLIDLIRS